MRADEAGTAGNQDMHDVSPWKSWSHSKAQA